MPRTHDVGRLYAHRIRLEKGTPLHHRYWTVEYEEPFRAGYSHIWRLPKTRLGLVLGRWGARAEDIEPHDPELAARLMKAMNAREERGDVLGEGGTSVQDHVRQAYERRLQKMGRFLEDTDELHGWRVTEDG